MFMEYIKKKMFIWDDFKWSCIKILEFTYRVYVNFYIVINRIVTKTILKIGGVDGTRTRDPRRDRPVF